MAHSFGNLLPVKDYFGDLIDTHIFYPIIEHNIEWG